MLPIARIEEAFPKLGIATFFIGCHSSKLGACGMPEVYAIDHPYRAKQGRAGLRKRFRSIPTDTNEV